MQVDPPEKEGGGEMFQGPTVKRIAKRRPMKPREEAKRTGAADPLEVTHAFTLSNPALTWLILHGYKIIENRQCCFAPGWYAVHTGAAARCSLEEERTWRDEFGMPTVMSMDAEEGRKRNSHCLAKFTLWSVWCGSSILS